MYYVSIFEKISLAFKLNCCSFPIPKWNWNLTFFQVDTLNEKSICLKTDRQNVLDLIVRQRKRRVFFYARKLKDFKDIKNSIYLCVSIDISQLSAVVRMT